MYVRQVLDRRHRRLREADHRVSTSGQRHRSRLWDQQQSRRSSRTAFRRRPHSTSVSVRTLWSSKLRRRYMQIQTYTPFLTKFRTRAVIVAKPWVSARRWSACYIYIVGNVSPNTTRTHAFGPMLILFTYCNTHHTRVILRFCRDCLA